MPNDLPPLPEPAFRLKWKDGAYYVSRPNIDDTDCYTYAQVREVQAIARQQGRDEMREWKASRVRNEAWQPIETAPRDSTLFLAYRRGEIAKASCLVRDDGEMWSFGNQSGHRDVYPDLVPSHWMPLPAPPVGTPKSAEGEGA